MDSGALAGQRIVDGAVRALVTAGVRLRWVEAEQFRDGAHVLKGARSVADNGKAGEHALRLALRATTSA